MKSLMKKLMTQVRAWNREERGIVTYASIFFMHTYVLLQCCGAVMICCGSGSDFGKVLAPIPVPAVPDPDNI
jgi:hypothetical protein